MNTYLARAILLLAGAIPLMAPSAARAACSGADCILGDSFEYEFFLPANDGDAARFLNQATFGATSADIRTVRANGPESWVDQQLGLPPTYARPRGWTSSCRRPVCCAWP